MRKWKIQSKWWPLSHYMNLAYSKQLYKPCYPLYFSSYNPSYSLFQVVWYYLLIKWAVVYYKTKIYYDIRIVRK